MTITVSIAVESAFDSTEQLINGILTDGYEDLPTECVLEHPLVRDMFDRELSDILKRVLDTGSVVLLEHPELITPAHELLCRLQTFGINITRIKQIMVRTDKRSVHLILE